MGRGKVEGGDEIINFKERSKTKKSRKERV